MEKSRILTGIIKELKPDEIFVFGSNESGRHGAGAAKTAMKWGAVYGKPEGIQGQTYAIPTVDSAIRKSLSLEKISRYVERFIQYASKHKDKKFLVTEIGCGLAYYTPSDIAPLFKNALEVNNIYLPLRFWEILNQPNRE